jgi:hypothetical protein
MDQLTSDERAILDFEEHWHGPDPRGAKDTAIWEAFGVLPARHAQRLLALLDRPEAAEYAPLLVSRLRRLRDARVAARAG